MFNFEEKKRQYLSLNPPKDDIEGMAQNISTGEDASPDIFDRELQNKRFSILLEIRKAFKEQNAEDVGYKELTWANTMIWNEVAGFIIRQIVGRGELAQKNLNSFISACVVSILKNIDEFDPERGYKLTTFLTPYINNGISEEFKNVLNTGTSYFNQNIGKVKKAVTNLIMMGEKNPAIWQIAEVTGLTQAQVEAVIDKIAISEAISLDDEELKSVTSEFSNPLQTVIDNEGSEVLYEALEKLTSFEQEVLFLKYDFGSETERGERSINYIASKLGKRPDEISRVLVKCHRILRNNTALSNFYGKEYDSARIEEQISRSTLTETFFDEDIEELEKRIVECSVYDQDPVSTIMEENNKTDTVEGEKPKPIQWND